MDVVCWLLFMLEDGKLQSELSRSLTILVGVEDEASR